MEETFKTIEGFEDYQVSNLGRVVSNKNGKQTFLKPQYDALGYVHVRLYPEDDRLGRYEYTKYKYKKPKLFKVHKLVADAFLEDPGNLVLPTVNHKDGDKSNNVVTNLEWLSHRDNILHSWEIGLRDNSAWKAAPKRYKPIKITTPTGEVLYYKARKYAIMDLGIGSNLITKALRDNHPLKKGKWKGYMFEDCELPPGATFKKILDIEAKLLEYKKIQEYFRNKNRERRNNKRKNND